MANKIKTIQVVTVLLPKGFRSAAVSWVIAFVVIPLLPSCGYRPLLSESRSIDEIYIPLVQNQTSYEDVSAKVTTAIRQNLNARGIRVVKAGKAKAWTLMVTVTSIDNRPSMLKVENNQIGSRDILWTLSASIEIVDENGTSVIETLELQPQKSVEAGQSAVEEQAMGERARSQLYSELAGKIADYVGEF